MKKAMIILWVLTWSPTALVAYDCSSEAAEVTTISLRDIADCPQPSLSYSSTPTQVTVIQRNAYGQQKVWACLIEVTRIMTYCGMYSHSSIVSEGLKTFVHKVGAEECELIHRDSTARLFGVTIGGIIPNATTIASVTLIGQTDNQGKCVGETYHENGQSWQNVVVIASVKIQVRDFWATVKLDEDEISVSGRVTCPFLKGYCFDAEVGEAVWRIDQRDNCEGHLSLLYRGAAEEVTQKLTQEKYLVVTQGSRIFALSYQKKSGICGFEAWQTEHPRILIAEESFNPTSQMMTPQNTDLMAYVNSKFLYVEQAFKRDLEHLYHETIHRRCLALREILRNRLAMAHIMPTAISMIIKEHEGHIGRALGEVLYIIKCVPTPVEIRRTDRCYNDLPITVNNQSKFMAPLSRIIQDLGEEISCNGLTPPLYYLDGNWIGMAPSPTMKHAPPELEVERDPLIKFAPLQPLGSEGLYTNEEVNDVQKLLTFGNERKTITNILARKVKGLDTHSQGYSAVNLFDGDEIKNLASSTAKHLWGWFSDIGRFVSGLLGFYIIFQLLRYVIGVVINGLQLYQVVGGGIKLLACLWTTSTMWVLRRHQGQKRPAPTEDVETGYELKQLIRPDEQTDIRQLTKSLPQLAPRNTSASPVATTASMNDITSETKVHWTRTLQDSS